MRPRTVAIALVLLLASALPLGGCGGSEGGGDERPTNRLGVPIVPGGDNTIQHYGHEAGEAQREAVGATLATYAAARDSGEWVRACELMSAELHAELRTVASKSRSLEKASCATVASLLAANRPRESGESPPKGATPLLVSFRVKGQNAIAIYTAAGRFYFLPFDRDRGEWLVSELNGEALLG